MPTPTFEPAIPVGERPQIHALDRAAIGMASQLSTLYNLKCYILSYLCLGTYVINYYTSRLRICAVCSKID
jgi:hypothetical protein